MSPTGRKRDIIWENYTEISKNNRKQAKCRECGKEIEAQVKRMKLHSSRCQPIQELEEADLVSVPLGV